MAGYWSCSEAERPDGVKGSINLHKNDEANTIQALSIRDLLYGFRENVPWGTPRVAIKGALSRYFSVILQC